VARGNGVIKHGTAKEIAEHATGYAANGESQHSRQIAHVNIKLGEGKRTNGRLIREQSGALAKLKHRATIEMDPERLAKIRKDIQIKSRFVAKLKSQSEDYEPDRADVDRVSAAGWNWERK